MKRPVLLNETELTDKLSEFELWTLEGKTIVKEIVAVSFAMAVGIVNSIAVLAEAMDHHPDILIYGWNKIRVTISTHDQGGLTILDFDLAKKIDNLKV
jgi:4a-hydroxytetrahydrobiopterin dehydratase